MEGSVLRNLSAVHEGCVWCLQPLESAKLMASAGADGRLRLWDARQANAAGEMSVGGAAYALAAVGDMLMSAGHDGLIRAWDVRAMRLATEIRAHSAPVRCLLAHSGHLWSGATDGTVRCWNTAQLAAAPPLGSAAAIEAGLQDTAFAV